jgi:hypothetical protein
LAIGRYPTFREWAVRQAAIETGRSFSRDRPPDTAVNAAAMSGAHDMTSRIASGSSTRGSIVGGTAFHTPLTVPLLLDPVPTGR